MKPDNRHLAQRQDRAVRTNVSAWHWVMSVLLLMPLFYLLAWSIHPLALAYWIMVLSRSVTYMDPALKLEVIDYHGDWVHTPLLSANIASHEPGTMLLVLTSCVCIVGGCASFARKERWLPFAYLLRIACATQFLVCLYFWFAPGMFPYSPRLHLRDIFALLIGAIATTPALMALLYYPLDFSLVQKALATALVLGYLIVATPFIMLLHIIVIHHGSLLFMPFCYFVLGVPLAIGLLVTLYAYCASWPGALSIRH